MAGVALMANFECKRCGLAIHLGRCESEPSQPVSFAAAKYIDRLPNGELVVKLNGVTVAYGFDSRAEAQEWIEENELSAW